MSNLLFNNDSDIYEFVNDEKNKVGTEFTISYNGVTPISYSDGIYKVALKKMFLEVNFL